MNDKETLIAIGAIIAVAGLTAALILSMIYR